MSKLLSLSTSGILTSHRLLMVKLFNYYIASDKSQSYHYRSQVYSLKYLYLKYRFKPDEFAFEVEKNLTEFLTLDGYFEYAKVKVQLTEFRDNYFVAILDITTTMNGRSKNLNEALKYVNNEIIRFTF